MNISNLKKLENGTYTMTIKSTMEEMEYLASFAVNALMALGAINLKGNEDQDVDVLTASKRTLN